jgi:hypothetical protein
MNKVFYPGMLTPDEAIKVMGEEYWPVLVTLNATMGFQVTNYRIKPSSSGKTQTAVGMVNGSGMAAFSVVFGPMLTKRNKYQGEGIAIVGVDQNIQIKSKTASYINRAINTNAELRGYLTRVRDVRNYFDLAVNSTVESYVSAHRVDRGMSCSSSQDTVMLKKLHGVEPLDAIEQATLNDLMTRYENEVVQPVKVFRENHASFFSSDKCVFLNVTQFSEQISYAVGVLDPKPWLKGANKAVNWIKPVKLYKSLHNIEDEELRAALFSRLVMIKLRHKDGLAFFAGDGVVPAFTSNVNDGLVLVRMGYSDRRSQQMMLINLG